MKKIIKVTGVILLANFTLFVSCKKKGCIDENAINYNEEAKKDDGSCEYTPADELEREKVIDDFNNVYLTSSISSNGWTGDVSACDEGNVSQECKDQTLKRLNYFRNLAGLNSVSWDASVFSKYQKAALIMQANNSLNHTPPNNWNCWTQEAYDGAYSANLSGGGNSPESITSYMRDFGASNDPCGHRRWILYSKQTEFSLGATSHYHALGVVGLEALNTNVPDFIAYPSSGYFPKEITFEKWSFGIPNANFSSANVQMIDEGGNNLSLTIVSKTDSYGDNSIVWKPIGIDLNTNSDQKYTITISNITNASQTSYSYSTTLIKAEI